MSSPDDDAPSYIYRDAGMMFAPPYLQADTFLAGWLLPSKLEAQQSLLDATVNRALHGRDIRYEAVVPRLMLSFADIQKVSSMAAEHQEHGYVAERDVTIWYLAQVREGDTIKRLVWFLPYIWVDNPLAVIVGREVFGFPKQLAEMTIPADRHDPGPFSARAPVLAHYSRDTKGDPQPLLTVRRSGIELESAGPGAELEEMDPAEMDRLRRFFEPESEEEGRIASAVNLIGNLLSNLRERTLPILFLKQFPSATAAGRACYQKVIEAPARVTSFHRLGLMPGTWTADLHSYASHRLRENLGLPEGPIPVGRGLWLKYSFSMELGREVG